MYKTTGLILLVLAYALLLPGLNKPMLTVTGTVEKNDLLELGKEMLADSDSKMGLVGDMATIVINNLKVSGSIVAFDKTRSILGTVRDLFEGGNALVALLIVTFSVLVPVFKGFVTLITLLDIKPLTQSRLALFSSAISKWSMADVFVIAIFVSYLAAIGIKEDTGLVSFNSTLGSGFYYFLGYCVVSILASQFIAIGLGQKPTRKTTKTKAT